MYGHIHHGAWAAAAIALVACGRNNPAATPNTQSPNPPAAAGPTAGRGCAENFAAFDDNDDKLVSLDEFRSRPHAHADPEAVFRARDRSGDGFLTAEEFCARWPGGPRLASESGASGSGPAGGPGMDMAAGRGHGMGRGPGMGMGPGGPCVNDAGATACPDGGRGMWEPRGGRRAWAPGGPMGMRCEDHFKAFDDDGNGKIDKQEFASWPHAHGDAAAIFAARDKDQDGVLTKDEFCGNWNRASEP